MTRFTSRRLRPVLSRAAELRRRSCSCPTATEVAEEVIRLLRGEAGGSRALLHCLDRWITPGRDAEGKQVLYFVQMGAYGPIKIGTTGSLRERFAALQIGSPEELYLLLILNGGGPDEERMLHQRFAHLRMRGEWFRPEPDLIEFIAQVQQDKELQL